MADRGSSSLEALNYTSWWGRFLNASLRRRTLSRRAASLLDALLAALKVSPALPEGVVLYRGVSDYLGGDWEGLREGKVLTNEGLTSFSSKKSVALHFSRAGYLIRFVPPRGARALHFDSSHGTSLAREEGEYVFPPGLKVLVARVWRGAERQIDVEFLGYAPAKVSICESIDARFDGFFSGPYVRVARHAGLFYVPVPDCYVGPTQAPGLVALNGDLENEETADLYKKIAEGGVEIYETNLSPDFFFGARMRLRLNAAKVCARTAAGDAVLPTALDWDAYIALPLAKGELAGFRSSEWPEGRWFEIRYRPIPPDGPSHPWQDWK